MDLSVNLAARAQDPTTSSSTEQAKALDRLGILLAIIGLALPNDVVTHVKTLPAAPKAVTA